MSDIFERHKELSKKVLIPGEHKSPKQTTPARIQTTPAQLIYPFSLGAILGFSIFVVIWIISGFSKLAIMLPFVGGMFGIAIKMIWQKIRCSV